MNSSPRDINKRRSHLRLDHKSRLELDETVYKSATEALEAYIADFEGGQAGQTSYRRRPSDLLSPAPKFYFMDSLERRIISPPSKSPAKKVDELLEWVNEAYTKELSSKVTPFGYWTAQGRPLSGSDEENMNPSYVPLFHVQVGKDNEVSTLPSPSSSVVDLDSNAGTVETEVLLSSYKGSHASTSGSYSDIPTHRFPPKSGLVKTSRSRPDGSTEYPSWVSGLGKEYPSWVEDLDISTRHKKVTQRYDKKYTSSTSSTSESHPRKETYLRSSKSTPAMKVSDLQSNFNSSSKRYDMPPFGEQVNGVDWNDAASTDTDMLVSQSVYGPHPVNMGGTFHDSLYHDKKVVRLKKESTKKLRKSTDRVKPREHSAVSPRRSKSLTYSPAKTLRFSSKESEKIKEYSEGKHRTPALRDSLHDSSPVTSLPVRYSIPAQNERYGIPDDAILRSTSPLSNRTYVSPGSLTRYSKTFPQQPEASSSKDTRKKTHSSKSPMRSRSPQKIDLRNRDDETDAESDDTERVMRKSPTGIKMEKIYRDPSTMYPWKSMRQSSRSHDMSAEFTHSKPQHQSTPMVYADREPLRVQSSLDKHYRSSDSANDIERREQRIAPSEAAKRLFERKGMTGKYLSTPKPVFASSSYRSKETRLVKSSQNARYSKPPPAPRASAKKLAHRRTKTAPDLRRIAINSATRPKHSRRSLDDDNMSVYTADTETLITRPPMPVFDASPSLTTVSDSETVVESETEGGADIISPEKASLSPRHVTAIQGEDKFSPTSVFASTNPHAAMREELPERFHLWKLDEDTKVPESFIKRRFTSPKSGIISSFLEDCLSVDSDPKALSKPDAVSPALRLSGKEAAPGPVEALKQMLFTMQDIAHHETLNGGDNYKPFTNTASKSREELGKNSLTSDDQSDRDLDVFSGEVSLQRAYHHLERLKRLVGKEDDRSSVSSVN